MVRNDDADLAAEAHEKRVATELNSQFEELRDQSQSLIAAVKGRRGIQTDEHWQAVFLKAKINYENGRFLLQQLGAERYLEPELMATLAQLRQDLLLGIYFAAERPVVMRNGQMLVVDDERMRLEPGETPSMRRVRFRTLGCWPLTAAIDSDASDIDAVVAETLAAKVSERAGRLIDHDQAGAMEMKKREGYF